MQNHTNSGLCDSVSRQAPKICLPDLIETEPQLDEVLTRPCERLVEVVKRLSSPLMILEAEGKMGPTLAELAKRAAIAADVNLDAKVVSRLRDGSIRTWIENHGVRTIACDLLDRASVEKLPESSNLIYLVGLKFGTRSNPSAAWATNTVIPALVCERYPNSKIVALYTDKNDHILLDLLTSSCFVSAGRRV